MPNARILPGLLLLYFVPALTFCGAARAATQSAFQLEMRQLKADKAVFQLGEENCTVTVEVSNPKNKAIGFDLISVSCGCVSGNIKPFELSPGERRQMTFSVNTLKSGTQGATVKLMKKGVELPIAFCNLEFEVLAPFQVRPEITVLKDVDVASGAEFTIELFDSNDEPVKAESIIAHSLTEKIKVVSIEDGKVNARILKARFMNPAEGMVLIRVPDLSPRYDVQTKVMWEYKPVGYEVKPSRLFIGRVGEDGKEFDFRIISHVEDKRFEIESMTMSANMTLEEWHVEPSEDGDTLNVTMRVSVKRPPKLEDRVVIGSAKVTVLRDNGRKSSFSVAFSGLYTVPRP